MNLTRFATPFTIATLSLACMLGGCSKDDATASNNGIAASLPNPQNPQSVQQMQEAAHAAALPQPSSSVPLDQYVPIKSGETMMYMFYALSKMPPDMDAIAEKISSDYRATSDQFKRQDMLKVLGPRIQSNIAAQSQNRYVVWDMEQDALEHYDFNAKHFPIKADYWNGNNSFYWNDIYEYKISFSAPEPLHFLNVADEAQAREIESLISKYQSFHVRVYAFVQDTDLNAKTLKAVITHIEIADRNGRKLAAQ